MASVFVNRLQQGMRLQTDPTVIYGITKGEGVLGRGPAAKRVAARDALQHLCDRRSAADADRQPGAAEAIEAALNPDTTDYLFFVADGTGGHAFAATLDEHNDNVAQLAGDRGRAGRRRMKAVCRASDRLTKR